MVRLGMNRVFEEAGIEVVGEEERPDVLVELAAQLRPDIVVLDLWQEVTLELSERVRAAAPESKIILWTRDEEVMEVLDPGASVPRRFFEAVPQGLRDEVKTAGTPPAARDA
jgi:DNA-binding NarL/FixJ family response regulator